MNRARTQFAIASIALSFLGVVTLVAVVGDVILGQASDLTMILVGSLTTAAGQAMSYFFRINNHTADQ